MTDSTASSTAQSDLTNSTPQTEKPKSSKKTASSTAQSDEPKTTTTYLKVRQFRTQTVHGQILELPAPNAQYEQVYTKQEYDRLIESGVFDKDNLNIETKVLEEYEA